jgi:divalent metal cation (Fe/Co/Zn/Cd) transporter
MANKTTSREDQSSKINTEVTETVQDGEHPHGLRLSAILAALLLSIFLASLDATIISTAIPSITNQFHSLQDVGWYGSAMFFPLAATQVRLT